MLQLALRATPAKLIEAPHPELPVGISGPATVFLRAVLDSEGRLLEPSTSVVRASWSLPRAKR